MAEFLVTLRILAEGMAGVFGVTALIWAGTALLRRLRDRG